MKQQPIWLIESAFLLQQSTNISVQSFFLLQFIWLWRDRVSGIRFIYSWGQLSTEARSEMRSRNQKSASGRQNIFGQLLTQQTIIMKDSLEKVRRQTNIISPSPQYPDYFELPSNPLFPMSTHLLVRNRDNRIEAPAICIKPFLRSRLGYKEFTVEFMDVSR